MAKNKRWNKVIARIQALEDALASLLTGKSASGAKRKKTKKKASAKRKASAKKPAPKPARAKKNVPPKPRKKNPRAAESAPILPQPPIPSL